MSTVSSFVAKEILVTSTEWLSTSDLVARTFFLTSLIAKLSNWGIVIRGIPKVEFVRNFLLLGNSGIKRNEYS